MDMILRYITELNEHDSPVSEERDVSVELGLSFDKVIKNGHRTPDEYRQMFRFQVDDQGIKLYDLLANCERVLETSVRAGHPRFINQLSQGVDMISLVGEMITSSINANMFTYEVAPVFNLMEESILALMRHHCGWSNEQEPTTNNGDGLLAPGGALSNLYAVLAARHHTFPDIKEYGFQKGQRPAMIISRHVRLLSLSI